MRGALSCYLDRGGGARVGALCVRLALAAIATVVAVGTLHAEPARPRIDAATRAQAEAHFRQGQAFFQHGDYDRAIVEYQAADDLSGEPSLIFNIALCHDPREPPRAGDPPSSPCTGTATGSAPPGIARRRSAAGATACAGCSAMPHCSIHPTTRRGHASSRRSGPS